MVKDGELIAAVEEERFNRFKHCAGFPTESVRYCLRVARIKVEDIDHIGISRDPSAHLHKKVLFAARRTARGISNFEFRNSYSTAPQEGGDPNAPVYPGSRGADVEGAVLVAKEISKSEVRNPVTAADLFGWSPIASEMLPRCVT